MALKWSKSPDACYTSLQPLETMIDTSLNTRRMTDVIQLKGISASMVDKAALLFDTRLIKVLTSEDCSFEVSAKFMIDRK